MMEKWVNCKGRIYKRSFNNIQQLRLFKMWGGNTVYDTRQEAELDAMELREIGLKDIYHDLSALALSVKESVARPELLNSKWEKQLWEKGEEIQVLGQSLMTAKDSINVT